MTNKPLVELFYGVGLVLFGGMMSLMVTGCPPSDTAAVEPEPPEPTSIPWEKMDGVDQWNKVWRTPVPGGWLLMSNDRVPPVFLPDKDHEWLRPKVEVDKVDYIKLYLAADRATLEAVRPALLEYDHVSEESHHPSNIARVLDAWQKRIDAAEAHQ